MPSTQVVILSTTEEFARLAGALAYYILKAHAFFDGNKRTALLASTAFMALNGWELRYPMPEDGWCDLAKILDSAAANLVGMDELKDWYEPYPRFLNKPTSVGLAYEYRYT